MLTIYYVAATWLQSRKLSSILQKIRTVRSKNGTVVIHQELPPFTYTTGSSLQKKLEVSSVLSDQCVNYKDGHIGDLLWFSSSKRVASIYPEQLLDTSGWISIIPGQTHLPIQIKKKSHNLGDKGRLHVLIEANYNTCQFNFCSNAMEIEKYGVPVAWHVDDRISILLETNEEKLSYMSLDFMQNDTTLENGIEIMRIESVHTIGTPYKIQNIKSVPETYAPLQSGLNKEEMKISFMGRWRAHISMLCTFCEAVSQVKNNQQDIAVRHPGSGVGAVKLIPGGYSESSNSPLSPTFDINEEPETIESPVPSVSERSTTPANSARLPPDSISTSMSSLRSLPTTPRKTISTTINSSRTKPPNIMIFSDSSSSAESVKVALESILVSDRYTIHTLNFSDMHKPWLNQADLVMIHGNVPQPLNPVLLNYLLINNGSLLCLCSDFLGSILPMFHTAEVRPNELVHCTYKTWKHVPLMHHVFCYQPTPSAPQFTHDELTSLSSILEFVEVTDSEGKVHKLKIDVLGAEDTWQTPSLLLLSFKNNSSKILFSQVHLEIDPAHYEIDDKQKQALTNSNKARKEILCDVLSKHFGLQCSLKQESVNNKQAYFLGKHETKQELLEKLKTEGKMDGDNLKVGDLHLKFCGKGVKPVVNSSQTSVLMHSCPELFSTYEYFENLKTEKIGRLVVFSEIMGSSMDFIEAMEFSHGFTVIPYYQSKGKGRCNNTWLSPKGCAMFSIQLHIPLDSYLGRYLPIIQHVASLAIVSSICENPGLEDLDIGLKWPNDIYANKLVKVGGVMATSKISNNKAICNLGCGINLKNKEPTICINDIIQAYSKEKGVKLNEITYEKYFCGVFNKLESLLKAIESDRIGEVYAEYYNYWLHSDAEVEVTGEEGLIKAKIKGIDDYGFLSVETCDGQILTVQPDGNSFDMMAGLIVPKLK